MLHLLTDLRNFLSEIFLLLAQFLLGINLIIAEFLLNCLLISLRLLKLGPKQVLPLTA
jgi:hypothetical protein